VSSLRDTQRAFRTAVLGAGSVGGVAGDGLRSDARVAIYRHHVTASLTGVLKGVYPVVCRLVDERFFGYAADRFIARHPPLGPCLWEYGQAFAAFLATFEPCRTLPYLPDVARLEWAMSRALHADDDAALDGATLRRYAPADLADARLRFHPSFALVDSPWPVDRIWRANQPDADPRALVDLGAGPARLAVWRAEDDVVFRALDPGAHALRRALHAGRPLGDAAAAAREEDPTADLTALLRDLFGDNTLVDFTLTIPKEDLA
jgi:hypothetical protein